MAITKYPQSYQQDCELLEQNSKDHKLSYNEYNCIVVRKGEKKLLLDIIEFCDKILPCLEDELSTTERKKRIDAVDDN